MKHIFKFIKLIFGDLALRKKWMHNTKYKADFVFLVHPRDKSDILKRFPFLKILPARFLLLFLKWIWPLRIHKIKVEYKNNTFWGWTIAIPLLPKQILNDRALAKKKTLQALHLGDALGASIAGLGALLPSITNGGLDLIEESPLFITNGYANTVRSVAKTTVSLINQESLEKSKIIIAIVGAAGSVGGGVAKLLKDENFKEMILVDLARKKESLSSLLVELKINKTHTKFSVATNIKRLQEAHIIITATNADEFIINSEHVSDGTLIVDDAQPSDVNPTLIRDRKNVVVVEAGIIHSDSVLIYNNLELNDKHDMFSCLAEVILLSMHKKTSSHFSIGRLDNNLIKILEELMESTDFRVAEYQNYLGVIQEKQLASTITILKARYGSR